jgi:hypothetical protein
MAPGIVLVWSGNQPRYDPIEVPRAGLQLGRELLDPSDIEISRHHVELIPNHGRLLVRDLGSRNACTINGESTGGVPEFEMQLGSILRIGRTVALAVDDVSRYRGVSLTRRGKVVVAASLAESCRKLDAAALAEDHVALFGSLALGRELAGSYATRVGGDRIVVELEVTTQLPMEQSIDRSRSPRTMILVLNRPLTLPDQPELVQWLETDVRIVSVARCTDSFKYMPTDLITRLTPHAIELPAVRLDELPATVADFVTARAPKATVHASLIETVLLQVAGSGEERLFRWLDGAITEWGRARDGVLQGRDLEAYIERDQRLRNCVAGSPL